MAKVDQKRAPQRQPKAADGAPCADKPRIIVGIGHDYRRDDAVGLVVARRIQAEGHDDVTVLCLGEDLFKLLDVMQPGARIVVVDAVVSGAPAGTIHRVDLLGARPGSQIPATSSSHAFDLVQVLALAGTLARVPAAFRLVGVEAADVAPGVGLSPAVAAAVDCTVAAVHATLARAGEVRRFLV